MAKTKASTRRPKSVLEQDRYTAELSTGQLVIGVCILLMFGLGCFLLGVLIGKFDPSLQEDAVAQRPAPTEATAAVPEEPAPAPVQTSPPAAEPEPAPPPEMRVPPRVLEQEQEPMRAQTAEEEPASADPEPEPDVATTVSAAAQEQRLPPAAARPQAASPAEQPEDEPESEDVAPERVAQAPAEAAPAQPEPSTAQSAEAATPRTRFAVQIAAFETRQRADVSKQQLESRSSYQAQIITSASGQLYKVVVGSYADRATADQVRTDLRTRYRYSDCFVTTLQ